MITFGPLGAPVRPKEIFIAPAEIDFARGKAEISRVVKEGLLRPSDIDGAEIETPELFYLPFYRVDVAVDGFHVGTSTIQIGSGRTSIPIPMMGARHRDAVIFVCARTLFPFEAKLPSFFGRMGSAPPIEIATSELSPFRNPPPTGALIEADVQQVSAEQHAAMMVLRAVQPGQAIYSDYKPVIRSTMFCLLPVYYAGYRYSGEAQRKPDEALFVAICARTGQVISAQFPSAARAVAAKFRKLLSFDW
jgi:hypothetical protein